MNVTQRLNGIVLARYPFREVDAKVILYTQQEGKLELVCRGACKPNSKLIGHLEPMNLVNVMRVNGKRFDYVGSVYALDCFARLKSSWQHSLAAGRILHFLNQHLRPSETALEFSILHYFFSNLNQLDSALNPESEELKFKLYLLNEWGYYPRLQPHCLNCHSGIRQDQDFYFSYRQGGAVCQRCSQSQDLLLPNSLVAKLKKVNKNTQFVIGEIKKVRQLVEGMVEFYLKN